MSENDSDHLSPQIGGQADEHELEGYLKSPTNRQHIDTSTETIRCKNSSGSERFKMAEQGPASSEESMINPTMLESEI